MTTQTKKTKTTVVGGIWKNAGKEGKTFNSIKLEASDELLAALENATPGKNGKKAIFVRMQKPKEKLEFLLSQEFITPAQYEERLERTPDNLLYELSISNG